MKNILVILINIVLVNVLFSQDMIFHNKDNTKLNVPLVNVDSITFAESLPAGSPCPGVPTVTYSGKTYNTVQIGNQCWLKENLDVGIVIGGSVNQANNGIIEKYCYNNNVTNCNIYGGLYQWDEAMQYVTTPGTQGICPAGWHIPTQIDQAQLLVNVKGDGNSLKAIGQGTSNGTGTNTSGFSALLAGYRSTNGTFSSLGNYAYFWSSTENGATNAYGMYLYYNSSDVTLSTNDRNYGFSVRCVKD